MLACVYCGGAFVDTGADSPVCPHCGHSWYEETNTRSKPVRLTNLYTPKPQPQPTFEDRIVYWSRWLEANGITDVSVMADKARRMAIAEKSGKLNVLLMLGQAKSRQASKQAPFVSLEEQDDSDPFSPEDYLLAAEIEKVADEVWAEVQHAKKRHRQDMDWREAVTYAYKDASSHKEYKSIRIRVSNFRARLLEKLQREGYI